VEKHASVNKKDEYEDTTRTKEKEEEGKAEKNARGRSNIREQEKIAKLKEDKGEAEKYAKQVWLCIPTTIRQQILHQAHNMPVGGHFSADRTYFHMTDRYMRMKMWGDTQQ
jgi:hypothetical protein